MALGIQPAGASSPVVPLDGSSPLGIQRDLASLLPEPGAAGLTGTEDALAMMYSLVAKQGEVALALGENGVAAATRDQDAQLALERQAELAQQQADANQGGGFWHDLLSDAEDVAKVAGIVVAVAAAAVATVCTAGAAGIAIVAVAAVLVSSGAAVSATHCFGKDSEAIGIGMEVAGSVLTMGAAASTLSATALTQTIQAISTVSQATQGAAMVLAGISSIEVAKFQGESEDDAADVQQALNKMNEQGRLVSDLLASMKSYQESNKTALKLVAGAAQTYGQTLSSAASEGKA